MRFSAAVGIGWDHARAPGADIGYLALSLFLVLTADLAIGSFERSGGRQDQGNFWLIRARRILLPWLFWFFASWSVTWACQWLPVPRQMV